MASSAVVRVTVTVAPASFARDRATIVLQKYQRTIFGLPIADLIGSEFR